MDVIDGDTWIALVKIIWVNVLLSGDNAVVIALAARNLQPSQRRAAVFGGSAAAIVLRVVLTVFAVRILQYPYLKLVGAVLLFWIGMQLLAGEDDAGGDIHASDSVGTAIRTILVADLVMSLDNVIAVAAAANSAPPQTQTLLLIVGLALSIPLIIFGSTLLMKLMDRYPVIITVGAALLGFVAGEMALTDPAVADWVHAHLPHAATLAINLALAVLVVITGKAMARRAAGAGAGPDAAA